MPKVLLTGRPAVGKTTVIQRTLDRFPRQAAGFITREMRVSGRRAGFEIQTLSGERAVLAHVERTGSPRVSRYGVDVAAFERVGVAALERGRLAGELVVIDEIGPMELLSDRFRQVVREIFEEELAVLGTVMARPDPFADEIRRRPGVEVLEVTVENRGGLVDRLLGMFEGAS